jgi:hypothetical protein
MTTSMNLLSTPMGWQLKTEEDTFIALRRIPFSQMIRIWSDDAMMSDNPNREQFFNQYGWTWDEYMEIYNVKKEEGHPDIFGE